MYVGYMSYMSYVSQYIRMENLNYKNESTERKYLKNMR